MTTLDTARIHPLQIERRFFFAMAVAVAVTTFIGFGMAGARFSFAYAALPPLVQAHAAVFVCWILFFVAQNGLVAGGSVALHRRLGWIGAVAALVMTVLGVTATVMAIKRGATPPFFPPNIFLALNSIGALTFGGLTAWAVALRNKPDWHRRLMLCGTIVVMSPAFGRILPMPQLGPAAPLAVMACMQAFVLASMAFDVVTRRRVHPANLWGFAIILATQFAIAPIAFSPPVRMLTSRLLG